MNCDFNILVKNHGGMVSVFSDHPSLRLVGTIRLKNKEKEAVEWFLKTSSAILSCSQK